MPQKSDLDNPTTQLLQQAGAMRSLARRLLGDREAANEAAHEVWLASTAASGDSERGHTYVRASLRNRLRDWRRSRDRRRQREDHVASRGSQVSTDDVVAQAEIRQCVLEAVKSLAEPLRTTIWLRFFDDLPPRTIAKRMRVPVNTVRSRVRLGVVALRQRLDRLHDGDRKRWQLALLPAAGWPIAAVVVSVLGVLTMKKIMLLAGSLLFAFVGGYVALQWLDPLVVTPVATAPESALALSVDVRDESQRRAQRDRTMAASDPESRASYTVQGSIALRMATDGTLVSAGSGVITIGDKLSNKLHILEVKEGRFSFSLAGKSDFVMQMLRLDEWSTENPFANWQCSSEQRSITVAVKAYPAGRVHVVAAGSLQPLRGVDVMRVDMDTNDALPPADVLGFPDSPHVAYLQGTASPCFLTGVRPQASYYVSAPSYAWQRIEIDHEHGGDRVVALHPGGDLQVSIRNAGGNPAMRLRVRHGEKCLRELSVSADKMLVGRLPVGPLTVSLEYGERIAPVGQRHEVATSTFTITAGRTTQLVLDCVGDAPALGPLRELHGTLTVSKAWGKTTSQILLIPTDRAPLQGEIKASRSRRRLWPLAQRESWQCSNVLPGRYRLLVTGFGMERDVEVPADGPVPVVDIVAPDPVESELVVLERGTGIPVHCSGVHLMRRGPDGVYRFIVRGRYLDGSGSLLRSLPGDYRLQAWMPRRVTKDVHVRAGSKFEFLVERSYGTLLVFRSGNAHVLVDSADVQLTSDVPGARVLQCLKVGFMLSTHVSRKGPYRLRVTIPGYRPLDTVLTIGEGWEHTYVPIEQV